MRLWRAATRTASVSAMCFPTLRIRRGSILAGILASLAGCNVPVPETVYSPCNALSSANWTARVEGYWTRHGKPLHRRNLIVEGDVTMPSGGYALSIEPGALQRTEPRFQQVHLRTQGEGDAATQAVTTQHVVGRFPYDKKVEGVAVRCGDGIIAEIADIAPEPSAQ